jgi:HK97 family phage portal protein
MEAMHWFNADRVKQHISVVLMRALPTLKSDNAARRARLQRSSDIKASSSNMSPAEFSEWLQGVRAGNGIVVTERTAMCISAVYACVALIGGAVLSLPLKFYRRNSDGDRERYTPDEWWLLNEQPFTCWGAATAWEFALWSLLLQGDSFWRIHRASRLSPQITGFEPLHPGTVVVTRVLNRLVYRINPQPAEMLSGTRSQTIVVDQDDILHVPGPGFDGLRGMSQIANALATPGAIALSADVYARAFFDNGARPDYALQTDANMQPEQIANLRNQLDERHQGAARAWRPIVLQGGLKVEPITMTAEDSQLIEQRRFQVEDIARVFGVPPFMIGHTEKTSSWGSGVESMGIGFVKYTLSRHLVKFEQEINRKVFRTGNRFCEFDTAGLERGDLKTRFDAYRVALGRAGEEAWMTINEVRRAENRAPVENGDALKKGSNEAVPAPAGKE